MSKSRTTPKKKPTPSQVEPGPTTEIHDFDASQVDTLLPQLFARHPPITAAHREAFASLIDDAQAEALGARTQAADIRAQAVRWAPILDAGVREHPEVLQGYTSARYVHFLEGTEALHQAIRADAQKRNKVDAVKSAVGAARTIATGSRDALYRPLRAFAGQRPAEREALAAAFGNSQPDDSLLASLGALAKLGQAWLDRPDATSKILAATAHLTPSLVAAALDAARQLKGAMSGATIEGSARVRDSASVNRLEGRLTFELLEARRIWNDANRRTGLVPKLSPGASVRHVFVRKTATGVTEEDPTEPVDAPAGDAPAGATGKEPPKG